jgi:murein DD-endopeptidase MepM/ murein hydrolase activator NlpD
LKHGAVLGLMGVGLFLAVYFPTSLPFQDADGASITGLSIPSIGVTRQTETIIASAGTTDTVRGEEFNEGLHVLAGESTATPQGQGGDTAGASEVAAAPSNFSLYAVQEGDTASSIAAANGISLDALLAANPDLRDGDAIGVGQMLVIPNGDGVLYYVRYGETLSDVADNYGVSIDEILNWPGNGLASPDELTEGQMIFIPGASAPVSVAAPEPAATEPPVSVVAPLEPPPISASEPPPVDAPAASAGLVWPVYGPISSYMDYSHPLGIDIDLFNNPGAAIVAATSGTVTFAGGDPCCSYGYHVIIMSPDGIETVYAHFSGFAVSTGDVVSQGQVIGYGGCTGYCTGSHLHFEVIDNGVRVDPLAYLP